MLLSPAAGRTDRLSGDRSMGPAAPAPVVLDTRPCLGRGVEMDTWNNERVGRLDDDKGVATE